MPARRLLRTSLTGLAAAAVLGAGPPAALATLPGDNGRLAFHESHPGVGYLESIMPNGSSGRLLGTGYSAAWSPDGTALVKSDFSRAYPECEFEELQSLFIASADGDVTGELDVAAAWGETWSPDGTQIAYVHHDVAPPACGENRDEAKDGIWVINRDGSGKRQLFSGEAGELEWSPDGSKFLLTQYIREPENNVAKIFTVNADGSGLRQLTQEYGDYASWSPDGRQIAYDGGGSLRIMNADGSNNRLLTSGYRPVWAPDGKTIAFGREDGTYLIDPVSKKTVKAFVHHCDMYSDCNAYDAPYLSSAPESWQPLPLGSNLLGNPSFETDLSGWGSYAGAVTRVAQPDAPEGSYVAKATRASGATKFSISDGQGGYKETIPFTSAGETYVGAVQVKAASSSSVGKPVTVYLREKSPSGATVRESKVASTLSSSWKRVAVSAKVSGTGNSLGLRVEQTSAVSGNAFYGDAFSLTKARTQVGSASVGTLLTTLGGDSKRASRVSVDTDFDAVRLRAYLDGKGGTSGSQSVRGVIYADSNGAPGARVASTSSVSVAAGRAADWVDFELSRPVSLNAGSYWVGLHSSTPSAVARWAGTRKTGALRFNSDPYSDGAASSFGTARTDDKEMSLQVVGG